MTNALLQDWRERAANIGRNLDLDLNTMRHRFDTARAVLGVILDAINQLTSIAWELNDGQQKSGEGVELRAAAKQIIDPDLDRMTTEWCKVRVADMRALAAALAGRL